MSDSRPPRAPDPAAGAARTGATAVESGPAARDAIPREFGRYRIVGRIGRGGMGAVFRAHDTQLDRAVALKVPFIGRDPGVRARFYREARAAAALHHPNICPVYDVGEFAGVPYLTMAYVEGRSLAAELEAGRVFAPRQAALLVRKLALAMQAAHAAGVVHRDLKPANVLVRPDGEPVVTDFGLARRADDPRGEGTTRQGDVIGTIEYMAPEQFEGDNAAVGPASDVYALGVVLYELLAGRRPFAGGTAQAVAAILLKPPPRPGDLRPGVPARLEEICLTAMAKRPADRYPAMAAFAAALTDFLRTDRPSAAPAAPPAARLPGSDTRPVRAEATQRPAPAGEDPGWEVVEDPPPAAARRSPRSAPRKGGKRRKRAPGWWDVYRPVVLGAAALVAAVLFLAAAAVTRSGGRPAPGPAPTPARTHSPGVPPDGGNPPAPPPAAPRR